MDQNENLVSLGLDTSLYSNIYFPLFTTKNTGMLHNESYLPASLEQHTEIQITSISKHRFFLFIFKKITSIMSLQSKSNSELKEMMDILPNHDSMVSDILKELCSRNIIYKSAKLIKEQTKFNKIQKELFKKLYPTTHHQFTTYTTQHKSFQFFKNK